MWDQSEIRHAQARYDELLREAKLVRLAKQGQSPRRPRYARLLEQFGIWLIACGWRLRARYGALDRTSPVALETRHHLN